MFDRLCLGVLVAYFAGMFGFCAYMLIALPEYCDSKWTGHWTDWLVTLYVGIPLSILIIAGTIQWARER